MLHDALSRLERGIDLTFEEAVAVIEAVISGSCEGEIARRILAAMHWKGEAVDEVAGAAQAMRKHMLRIRPAAPLVVDIVGTGGDGAGTFNISTAAAIVTAAAGVPVAKHGNRRITSRSGAADVLALLGVAVDADPAFAEECLNELGICFCFAPKFHPAMRNVADIRAKLGHPTIFNLLGPLTNPAGASVLLLGVGREHLHRIMSEAVRLLGTERSAVVFGGSGMDEIDLSGLTRVILVEDARTRSFGWTWEDFGLGPVNPDRLQVAGPEQSAALIAEILSGCPSPAADVVAANAGAALWLTGKSEHLDDCVELARQAVQSGAAADLLQRWIAKSRRA
ncbi:MAG: anthranilate phosphoribosyltransferase [Thermogutta sp.]|nr:anthranilate phosphoribosyltransferase [Thermogutta sp.]